MKLYSMITAVVILLQFITCLYTTCRYFTRGVLVDKFINKLKIKKYILVFISLNTVSSHVQVYCAAVELADLC